MANEKTSMKEYTRELAKAMIGIKTNIRNYLERTYPIYGDPHEIRLAQVLAGVLLALSCEYAVRAGINPIQWLRDQLDLNERVQKVNEATKKPVSSSIH